MKKKHPGWIKKLRSQYRLLLINDTNFQEKANIKLSPLSVIMLVCTGFLLFFALSWLLIFTVPALRVYMPGYEPDKEKKFKQEVLKQLKIYEKTIARLEEKEGIMRILLRGDDLNSTEMGVLQDQIDMNDFLNEESEEEKNANESTMYPTMIVEEPSGSVFAVLSETGSTARMSGVFFPPAQGIVSAVFEQSNHPAVDIVTERDETVKATLDGTILFSAWTPTFGNVIYIQHVDNWISIYKHCAIVYKKKGSRVSAGEIIGMVGNSGSLSSGPHLHFELWHNGIALNPTDFILFK